MLNIDMIKDTTSSKSILAVCYWLDFTLWSDVVGE